MQRSRKSIWMLAFVFASMVGQVVGQAIPSTQQIRNSTDTTPTTEQPLDTSALEQQLPPAVKGFMNDIDLQLDDLDLSNAAVSEQEQDVALAISERVKATEWLGAIGPVALSPFFGLTCLSGIAIVGEDRLPADHYLRRASTPLRNPLVFLTFLVLTILTSIPKFSKVSKPFAQAVDQVETYSAIIILLVIRFMGGIDMGEPSGQQVVFQAGFLEFSMETLLMLATVINIIVINTIKFFFEVMIWLTPVPFIDAIFEAANKSVCAALAAIYAFNPTIATLINLAILACCFLAFGWVKRREVYYRTILFDFVRHWFKGKDTLPIDGKVVLFPKMDFEGIPAMSRCELSKTNDGWRLRSARWFRPAIERTWTDRKPTLHCGLLMNKLYIDHYEFRFGKRFNRQLAELAARLDATYDAVEMEQRPAGNLATEMA